MPDGERVVPVHLLCNIPTQIGVISTSKMIFVRPMDRPCNFLWRLRLSTTLTLMHSSTTPSATRSRVRQLVRPEWCSALPVPAQVVWYTAATWAVTAGSVTPLHLSNLHPVTRTLDPRSPPSVHWDSPTTQQSYVTPQRAPRAVHLWIREWVSLVLWHRLRVRWYV